MDDLTIHADGSGTFRYNINLSSNKIKVNSILANLTFFGKLTRKNNNGSTHTLLVVLKIGE
jgi:hypothetical protein